MPQFFGREIQVTVSGELKTPVSFRFEGRDYIISDILDFRYDHSFGRNPPRFKKWWQRHHRYYYVIRTAEGETFEIYYDRGTGLTNPERRKWYLYRRL